MIFLRYGAVSSGPVILTFNPKDPVYPESPELFAGDTVIEIKEDGTEDVFLHGNTNHGIKINSIWPADGVVHFNQVIRAWGEHYSTYTYALLRQYDAETGKAINGCYVAEIGDTGMIMWFKNGQPQSGRSVGRSHRWKL